MNPRVMLVASALIVCSAMTVLQAAEMGETRVYECMRVTEPPVIDGKLTDDCWREASKGSQFVRILKGPVAIQQTEFQVVYDDAWLYLGVTCLEAKPEAIQATVRSRDVSSVMGDDAVEMFFRPDLSAPDYYQLSANSLGARYDGKGFDASWNAEWQAVGSVGEHAWYLECAISFDSFGHFGVPGAVWGFNVNRDRIAGGGTEWSGWSDTMGGFHAPERFGHLIFGGEAGGVDRGMIIECARYAKESIRLERTVRDALRIIGEGGLEALEPEKREEVQPAIDAAEESLEELRALLGQSAGLDLDGWRRVTASLREAADEIGEVAWAIKFAALLADD